jgi:hypothetical protein
MSSAGNTPAAPRPSVFISYASEDRAAARMLRDAINEAGLDAWYDESELGGGDAWDQKIRRQIRDCDYFMPVISATTERRKEGYFRREWRLATERTLDMADDVLFLLPVVLDETHQSGARVPERFLSVQWLRTPAGQRTPALDALLQRLLAGEHTVSPRPPLVTRPPQFSSPSARESAHAPPAVPAQEAASAPKGSTPPPMPPFPHAPEKGGVGLWLKFAAEIVWWTITAAWLLLTRLPRWVRVIVSLWLVITLFSTCGRDSDPKEKPKAAPSPDRIDRAAEAAVEGVAAAIQKGATAKDWGKVGEEIGRRFGQVIEQAVVAGKPLVAAPFPTDPEDAAVSQFAQAAFSKCYGQLILARPNEVTVSPELPADHTDSAFAALGRKLGVGFVLGARLTKATDGARSLAIRLIQSDGGAVAWSGDFPIAGGDADEAGTKIAEAILPLLPPKK